MLIAKREKERRKSTFIHRGNVLPIGRLPLLLYSYVKFLRGILNFIENDLFVLVVLGNAKETMAQELIDLYTENVTIEWQDFSIMACKNQTSMRVMLFQCPLEMGYEEVLDKSCLAKRELPFDNASCARITTQPPPPQPIPGTFQCTDENYIGVYCNISNSPCSNPELCVNGGTCVPDELHLAGYDCQCSVDYSGDNCEIDNRVCKNGTCL